MILEMITDWLIVAERKLTLPIYAYLQLVVASVGVLIRELPLEFK